MRYVCDYRRDHMRGAAAAAAAAAVAVATEHE